MLQIKSLPSIVEKTNRWSLEELRCQDNRIQKGFAWVCPVLLVVTTVMVAFAF